ncbi:MAG: Fic family protein [Bacillota bacterium]
MDTNKIVHTPPQDETEIRELLKNLEIYMNTENDYDPLINMALIYFQFESIHPFYDDNRRTGRILNILYLVLENKIQSPILYLSKYIIENKNWYYNLLKKYNEDILSIVEMVMFVLDGVIEMSRYTIDLVLRINELINMTKVEMNYIFRDQLQQNT